MIVADSGSTKTTWLDVESGNMVVTEGLNPHFSSDEQILEACDIACRRFGGLQSTCSVYFYGAGCGQESQRARVTSLLSNTFGTSDIHVETDMLAACRATAFGQSALVGILGTGSNACLYDGRHIKYQSTSTGYILGDFGSANHVGRLLLNSYLTHHMPVHLRHMFHDLYDMSDAQLLDAVYHQPNPNRFLASLAPFATQHSDDDYCRMVIEQTLEAWRIEVLMPLYSKVDLPLSIVGSYAKAVEPILRAVMETHGLQVRTVVANPIDGLRHFHSCSLQV